MSRQSERSALGRIGRDATRRAEVNALAATMTAPPCDPASRAAQELAEFERGMRSRFDERIARGSEHTKTRHAHMYCGGGCGTKSKNRCGGRWWANQYPISLVSKTDATERIAQGHKTRAYLKAKLGC